MDNIPTYYNGLIKELKEQTAGSGVDVSQEGDGILVNLPDVTFAVNSAAISPSFQATLDKVDFTGATLVKATFRRAELASARFAEATAAGIDCTEAKMIGLHGGDECNFQGAVFRRSDLTGSNFTGALLDTADFAYAKAPNALFTEARLQGADLSRANLTRSVFDDADLSGAQLLQTNMLYCSLERVDFAEVDARLANLYSAGLWQAKTERANFDGANLAGTLLEEKR